MTNSFFVITIYKNGMDKDFEQWYQKLGLLHDCVFYFKYPILQCIQKLMFQVVSYADLFCLNGFKRIDCFLVMFLPLF
jgi:hypothetical protein